MKLLIASALVSSLLLGGFIGATFAKSFNSVEEEAIHKSTGKVTQFKGIFLEDGKAYKQYVAHKNSPTLKSMCKYDKNEFACLSDKSINK